MSVKGIFKILVGTIVFMIVGLLLVEYLNITSASTFMKGLLTNTIKTSCDYFAAETYKGNTGKDGGTNYTLGNMPDIYDIANQHAVSGRFFEHSDGDASPGGVWKKLYKESDDFKNWYSGSFDKGLYCNVSPVANTWRNLDMVYYGITGLNKAHLTGSEKRMGESYAENYMTPLNMGIPYMDKDTLTRIIKYNMVKNFSENQSVNIFSSASARQVLADRGMTTKRISYSTTGSGYSIVDIPAFVQYKGFRVYYDSFKIKDIKYLEFDISTTQGATALEHYTNMNADYLYNGLTDDLDERRNICVADIEYTIDVDYVGITPIARAMNFIHNETNVSAYGGVGSNTSGAVMYSDKNRVDTATHEVRQGSSTFTNARAAASAQQVPLSDHIYYYIVR